MPRLAPSLSPAAPRPLGRQEARAVHLEGALEPRVEAALHGRPDRVDAVVERAGLGPLAGRLVKACSGGEQQRLKFALIWAVIIIAVVLVVRVLQSGGMAG